ncbi:hypothetical protein DIPPA_25971 [Diplonema papillatum]|nr:hypothetical protein DIPPA_25971 [Diplonema papillatum]
MSLAHFLKKNHVGTSETSVLGYGQPPPPPPPQPGPDAQQDDRGPDVLMLLQRGSSGGRSFDGGALPSFPARSVPRDAGGREAALPKKAEFAGPAPIHKKEGGGRVEEANQSSRPCWGGGEGEKDERMSLAHFLKKNHVGTSETSVLGYGQPPPPPPPQWGADAQQDDRGPDVMMLLQRGSSGGRSFDGGALPSFPRAPSPATPEAAKPRMSKMQNVPSENPVWTTLKKANPVLQTPPPPSPPPRNLVPPREEARDFNFPSFALVKKKDKQPLVVPSSKGDASAPGPNAPSHQHHHQQPPPPVVKTQHYQHQQHQQPPQQQQQQHPQHLQREHQSPMMMKPFSQPAMAVPMAHASPKTPSTVGVLHNVMNGGHRDDVRDIKVKEQPPFLHQRAGPTGDGNGQRDAGKKASGPLNVPRTILTKKRPAEVPPPAVVDDAKDDADEGDDDDDDDDAERILVSAVLSDEPARCARVTEFVLKQGSYVKASKTEVGVMDHITPHGTVRVDCVGGYRVERPLSSVTKAFLVVVSPSIFLNARAARLRLLRHLFQRAVVATACPPDSHAAFASLLASRNIAVPASTFNHPAPTFDALWPLHSEWSAADTLFLAEQQAVPSSSNVVFFPPLQQSKKDTKLVREFRQLFDKLAEEPSDVRSFVENQVVGHWKDGNWPSATDEGEEEGHYVASCVDDPPFIAVEEAAPPAEVVAAVLSGFGKAKMQRVTGVKGALGTDRLKTFPESIVRSTQRILEAWTVPVSNDSHSRDWWPAHSDSLRDVPADLTIELKRELREAASHKKDKQKPQDRQKPQDKQRKGNAAPPSKNKRRR